MKIKQVDKRPAEGQFIEMWTFNGHVWTDNILIGNDEYSLWVEEEDEWVTQAGVEYIEKRLNPECTNFQWFIAVEEH